LGGASRQNGLGMKLLYLRIRYFFSIWRTDYYGEPIDAPFAWLLAGVMADYNDELCKWMEL
jgi:hypothetical protein